MNKDKNKVLYVNSTFTKELETGDTENASIYIEGYASTNDMDRSGDVVPASVWTAGIKNFLKNPIILAQHDHSNPIGRMVEHKVTPLGLYVKARISAATEVYNLIKDEVLTAFSIGFRVIDAEYNATTELFVIKELELLEISVVSVPCNQNTLFSLSKAFNDADDYISFKSQFAPESESAKGLESSKEAESTIQKEWKMNPEEIKQMVADAAKLAVEQTTKSLAEAQAAQAAAQLVKQTQDADLEARIEARVKSAVAAAAPAAPAAPVVTTVDTGAERIMADIEKRFADQAASTKSTLDGLQAALADKAAEIAAMQKSKMSFTDKTGSDPVSITEKTHAVMLASVLGKSIADTKYGRELVEKAGAHVPGATPWELEVSLSMELELRRKLVIAPLFRQIAMKTNVLSIPVNPEAGYANWATSSGPVNTFSGNTTLEVASGGGTAVRHQLKEVTLNAYKVATKEFLGYEEEEDSLLVLMPMIRDAMVRRCAKAIDSAMLTGAGDGTVPVQGLSSRAGTSGTNAALLQTVANGAVSIAKLRGLRAQLGSYGLDPADVVYIVNNDTYYDLLEDAVFMTMEKVGPQATVLTGQIGQIGGSPVITTGELAAKATGAITALTNIAALAVYLPNFLAGSQRGLRVDTQDLAAEQARVMVASMRVGMTQITANVGVKALRWTA
jgi:HK97 family phage prohead protease/HK97 family phage major capsid protein